MGILGIDLGGTNIRVGLVEDNNLVKVESSAVRKNSSETEVLCNMYDLIDRFGNNEIEVIGIGVPSVVNVEKGIVYDLQNIPSWKEVCLKDLLQAKYNVPCYVNNDANCFAVGEKYFGKAKGYNSIVGLIAGTGLGAGIIVNGQLYAGKNCGAGEFGMLPFKDNNYERYCSGQFFVNEHHTTGEELAKRARNGDLTAIEIFNEFGRNFGEAIKAVMYTIDPEIIVLGGSVSKSFALFKDQMLKAISTFGYSNSVSNLKIEVSEAANVAILGAAALYYDEQNRLG